MTGIVLALFVLALCAVVFGAIWSFRAWGVVGGLAALLVLGGVTWFAPFGWVVGLVGGLVLIPVAQKALFRKIAERQSRLSLPPSPVGADGPRAAGKAPGPDGTPPGVREVPLPAGAVRCVRCGRPTPAAAAAFDDEGKPLCPSCDLVNQADSGDRAALAGVCGTGYAAPGLAFLSLFFNPFWSLTVLAVAGGLGSFAYLQRNADARRLVPPARRLAAQICGLIGAVAALGVAVLTLYLAARRS